MNQYDPVASAMQHAEHVAQSHGPTHYGQPVQPAYNGPAPQPVNAMPMGGQTQPYNPHAGAYNSPVIEGEVVPPYAPVQPAYQPVPPAPAAYAPPPPPPAQFPPLGWAAHPSAPGYFYKDQEVLTEADLRARFTPPPAPAAYAPPPPPAPAPQYYANQPGNAPAPAPAPLPYNPAQPGAPVPYNPQPVATPGNYAVGQKLTRKEVRTSGRVITDGFISIKADYFEPKMQDTYKGAAWINTQKFNRAIVDINVAECTLGFGLRYTIRRQGQRDELKYDRTYDRVLNTSGKDWQQCIAEARQFDANVRDYPMADVIFTTVEPVIANVTDAQTGVVSQATLLPPGVKLAYTTSYTNYKEFEALLDKAIADGLIQEDKTTGELSGVIRVEMNHVNRRRDEQSWGIAAFTIIGNPPAAQQAAITAQPQAGTAAPAAEKKPRKPRQPKAETAAAQPQAGTAAYIPPTVAAPQGELPPAGPSSYEPDEGEYEPEDGTEE